MGGLSEGFLVRFNWGQWILGADKCEVLGQQGGLQPLLVSTPKLGDGEGGVLILLPRPKTARWGGGGALTLFT